MFICRDCGGYFTHPEAADYGFAHAFGYHKSSVNVCPYCESPAFAEAATCPKCGEDKMLPDDRLCPSCKHELLARIIAFFDELTEEEEDQFDEWFEGNSITDRRKFYDGCI